LTALYAPLIADHEHGAQMVASNEPEFRTPEE
jgi:hypothetical protein